MDNQRQGKGDQHRGERRKGRQKQEGHGGKACEDDAMQDAEENEAATHDIESDNGDRRCRQADRGHAPPIAGPRI